MKASPTDLAADALLAQHPDPNCTVLTSAQMYRISRTEVPISPEHIDYANAVIDKEDRIDTLRIRERERKRRERADRDVA